MTLLTRLINDYDMTIMEEENIAQRAQRYSSNSSGLFYGCIHSKTNLIKHASSKLFIVTQAVTSLSCLLFVGEGKKPVVLLTADCSYLFKKWTFINTRNHC